MIHIVPGIVAQHHNEDQKGHRDQRQAPPAAFHRVGQVAKNRAQVLPLQIDHNEIEQSPVKDVDAPVRPDVVPQQAKGQAQQNGKIDLGHIIENCLRRRGPAQEAAQYNARHHDGQREHNKEDPAVVAVLEHNGGAGKKPDTVNSEAQPDPPGWVFVFIQRQQHAQGTHKVHKVAQDAVGVSAQQAQEAPPPSQKFTQAARIWAAFFRGSGIRAPPFM